METVFRLHDSELTQQFVETIKNFFKNSDIEITIRDTANSPYDWTKPNRPATDYEFENMLAECEAEFLAGKTVSADDALNETLKTIGTCQVLPITR